MQLSVVLFSQLLRIDDRLAHLVHEAGESVRICLGDIERLYPDVEAERVR